MSSAPGPRNSLVASQWDKFFDKHMTLVAPEANIATKSRPPITSQNASSPVASPSSVQRPRKSRSSRELSAKSSENMPKRATITTESDWEEMMKRLRVLLLREGMPGDDSIKQFRLPNTRSHARPLVWKLLLDVRSLDPTIYLSLVARGPSPMHDKICNDAFRTLATDQLFKERVDDKALIRLLDAFAWRYHDPSQQHAKLEFSYVQGMNVLAAPFLYVMPSELEAFHCFCHFIEQCCPTYVQPTLIGVHRGLQLLERCLQIADPALFNHLRAMKLDAEVYAFPSVLTLCACTPPLRQVLQVWDYLLAFGAHLAVPCIVAQLLLIRDELMASAQPMKLLRQFPDLDARSVVGIATTFVRDLDDALYDELVHHTIHL